jgi:predicted metal-dependent phosphoesterase TrpH
MSGSSTTKMKIDLHIHSKACSDGNLSIEEIFEEASKRGLDLLSITDHDSIDCQEKAIAMAREHGISYITGVELNVTFHYLDKAFPLDFLGYGYDMHNRELRGKLRLMREHREWRALEILERLNAEFDREGIERFTESDLHNVQAKVDGALGRPHIASYLVEKGIVRDIQEAFDRYLVQCDVPKYPLSLAEASQLVRSAGGGFALAHPNDPHGTSLVNITTDLEQQTNIIEEYMLEYIDGVECWHSRHDERTTGHYIEFATKHGLVMTGGSDCHQKPILLGTLDIPDWVAEQFGRRTEE